MPGWLCHAWRIPYARGKATEEAALRALGEANPMGKGGFTRREAPADFTAAQGNHHPQTTAEISSLNTIARAETGINRPAPPPFSFIKARRRRWLAALKLGRPVTGFIAKFRLSVTIAWWSLRP
jgi:hypothetical protein